MSVGVVLWDEVVVGVAVTEMLMESVGLGVVEYVGEAVPVAVAVAVAVWVGGGKPMREHAFN